MTKNILVIFDCDGVLVDSEIIACSLRVKQLNKLGIRISLEDFISHFSGKKPEDPEELIEDRYNIKLPVDYHTSHKNRLLDSYKNNLKAIKDIDLVLKNYGFKAVASNGNLEKINTALSLTELDQYFDTKNIFSAEMVEKPKPSPDLYLYVCEKMGVEPENSLIIEDSISGLQAAQDAGIPAIAFTAGSHFLTKEQSDLLKTENYLSMIDNSKELEAFIKSYKN